MHWAHQCWFQTSLTLAALMMIFVQLHKRHLPQRDDKVASSVLPITLLLCPLRFDRDTLSRFAKMSVFAIEILYQGCKWGLGRGPELSARSAEPRACSRRSAGVQPPAGVTRGKHPPAKNFCILIIKISNFLASGAFILLLFVEVVLNACYRIYLFLIFNSPCVTLICCVLKMPLPCLLLTTRTIRDCTFANRSHHFTGGIWFLHVVWIVNSIIV